VYIDKARFLENCDARPDVDDSLALTFQVWPSDNTAWGQYVIKKILFVNEDGSHDQLRAPGVPGMLDVLPPDHK